MAIVAGNNKIYLGLQEVCLIVTKFVFSRQIFIKVPSIRFHGSSSNGSRADTLGQIDGRTDGHEANKRFLQLPEHAKNNSGRGVLRYIIHRSKCSVFWIWFDSEVLVV